MSTIKRSQLPDVSGQSFNELSVPSGNDFFNYDTRVVTKVRSVATFGQPEDTSAIEPAKPRKKVVPKKKTVSNTSERARVEEIIEEPQPKTTSELEGFVPVTKMGEYDWERFLQAIGKNKPQVKLFYGNQSPVTTQYVLEKMDKGDAYKFTIKNNRANPPKCLSDDRAFENMKQNFMRKNICDKKKVQFRDVTTEMMKEEFPELYSAPPSKMENFIVFVFPTPLTLDDPQVNGKTEVSIGKALEWQTIFSAAEDAYYTELEEERKIFLEKKAEEAKQEALKREEEERKKKELEAAKAEALRISRKREKRMLEAAEVYVAEKSKFTDEFVEALHIYKKYRKDIEACDLVSEMEIFRDYRSALEEDPNLKDVLDAYLEHTNEESDEESDDEFGVSGGEEEELSPANSKEEENKSNESEKMDALNTQV